MNNTNNTCNSCYYCDSCDSCDSCDYCKNLKMTELNIFCCSQKYNDDNSFQQKRYRAFNKEVVKKRYYEICDIVNKTLSNPDKLPLTEFWESITKEQWTKLSQIPEFDKGVVEFITGIKLDLTPPLSGKKVSVTIDGKTYTATVD
jgi:hypothetical protein